jgi:tetratricopeptide (TPR) repeat protein
LAKKKSTKVRAQQKRSLKRTAKSKARSAAKAKPKVGGHLRLVGDDRDGDADGIDRLAGLPDRLTLEGSMARMFGGGGRAAGSAVNQAQELIYEAWDAPTPREAVRLAKEAIRISPDCADAYNLLAETNAGSVEDAAELYRAGVAAGERALGARVFEENAGHFWGLLETRPYMRAKQGLAQTLWALGNREEAVEHYRSMLRLNPNDNQGVRYGLATWLLALGAEEELEALLAQYEGDSFAGWTYTRALLAFRQNGDTAESRNLLKAAMKKNPYVPAFLLGHKKVPQRLPDYMGFGDETEAIAFHVDFAESWKTTPGALGWLRATTA